MTFSTYAVAPSSTKFKNSRCISHNDKVQFGGVTAASVNVVTSPARTSTMRPPGNISAHRFRRQEPVQRFTKTNPEPIWRQGGGPVRLPHSTMAATKTFFYEPMRVFRASADSLRNFIECLLPLSWVEIFLLSASSASMLPASVSTEAPEGRWYTNCTIPLQLPPREAGLCAALQEQHHSAGFDRCQCCELREGCVPGTPARENR